MAKRKVVISVCDRCTKEVQMNLEKQAGRRDAYVLPKDWLHVAANTRNTTVFEMDLCDECKVYVLKAAGAARK